MSKLNPSSAIPAAEAQTHPEQDLRVEVKHPQDEVPFGSQGAQFLCNLLQHGVFLGVVVFMLMVIGYFGSR